ncbi:hypothetical protein GA0074695_2928 [Micromonospora viridifaciens]|uniref:DUF6603 domain-containing protein n=1 Tax=Micromonospora viridifaciens TaxID=1881 RepID=A0A1C4X1L4_MICVI|nr:DUF6603 domain-containing protein [Micromonospora viridifaciens]SCF02338.1 hypothetical protein GA0074695_2928 [Micromonospora viridifaciens]
MATNPGEELLALLRRRLVELLCGTADAVRADLLDGLAPQQPPWSGAAVREHLLVPIGSVPIADPVANAVLQLLAGTLTAAGTPSADAMVSVHGWDPDPAAHQRPRQIAYALRAPQPAGDLTLALVTSGDAGAPALELRASGAAGGTAVIPLTAGWSVAVAGQVLDELSVRFGVDGPPQVTGRPGDRITVTFARDAPPQPDVGSDPGPALRLGGVTASCSVTITTGGTAAFTAEVRTSGGSIGLAPGGAAAILPGIGPVPLELDFSVAPGQGVRVAGSTTLTATLPVEASFPGGSVGPLTVELSLGSDTLIGLRVTTTATVELPGIPVGFDLRGLGLDVPFVLGDAGRIGFDPARLLPAEPDGADVDLMLPIVSGAGTVRRTPSGDYEGALALAVTPMSAMAFGVLHLDPLSFLVVIGATFPPPGVQIGFGFAVTGIGGIVGVGRRLDSDAMSAAITSGTAGDLLFSTDPQATMPRVAGGLSSIFPAASGHVVLGPMFKVNWGGRIISACVALILELPEPVRITLLGKLEMTLPDPAAPLVDIRVTLLGHVDLAEPSVSVQASLAGSSIAGVALTGDLYYLTRGGSDPAFVLSAGGFHPAFVPPRGVPPLSRLGLDLSSSPGLHLGCQAYLAVTSNTIQFGARVDLVAEVAGCGLHGWLGFDVLIQFDPFHFVAQIAAGIAVEVLGETLAGISLALALEGPAPWRARGTGSVDLFLFSTSFDFDVTWGNPAPPPLATPDVAGILAAAFAAREAWTAHPPDLARFPLQLTAAARAALADGTVVHPGGEIVVRQKRVPLGVTIDRFEYVPVASQRWDVEAPTLAPGVPAQESAEVREEFAAAAYLALTADQQLSRPAFEQFRAGATLSSQGVEIGPARPVVLAWETCTIDDELAVPSDVVVSDLARAMIVAAAGQVDHPMWWQPRAERVTVVPPRYQPADTWSLGAAPDLGAAATATEAHEAVAAARAVDPDRRVAVVEAWEVSV